MPCHHNPEDYLHAYIGGCISVGRRAATAGIGTVIGNHLFGATGITAYLRNGGTLERAALVANPASTSTTQLYDRRHDNVTRDEVERVMI